MIKNSELNFLAPFSTYQPIYTVWKYLPDKEEKGDLLIKPYDWCLTYLYLQLKSLAKLGGWFTENDLKIDRCISSEKPAAVGTPTNRGGKKSNSQVGGGWFQIDMSIYLFLKQLGTPS